MLSVQNFRQTFHHTKFVFSHDSCRLRRLSPTMEDALVSGLDSLSPPDSHYVNAAWGWLELDNITEAFLELDRISNSAQLHPDVLTLRWELLARKKQWTDALELA